ncbi:MAG: SxtJ family membrane protein [Candidatus Omnitrophota bacterium]
MDKLNLSTKNLRKFGITMAAAFLVISFFILIKHRNSPLPAVITAIIFFISAVLIPNLLKPVYIFWMRLAFILGWINTRLILCVIFFLILTPIGLVIKLFGIDLLDTKTDKNKQSYWIKKDKKEFSLADYERQF